MHHFYLLVLLNILLLRHFHGALSGSQKQTSCPIGDTYRQSLTYDGLTYEGAEAIHIL